MKEKLTALCRRYREFILYTLCGVLTVAVNVLFYWIFYTNLGWASDPCVIIAWLAAVFTAFLTNKPFVFQSHDWSLKITLREARIFFGFRLLTGILELILMHYLVTVMELPGMLMKILVNVIVIILNYIASKKIVFRQTQQQK